MRTRKEIEEGYIKPEPGEGDVNMLDVIEILLDIREILQEMHLDKLAERAGLK